MSDKLIIDLLIELGAGSFLWMLFIVIIATLVMNKQSIERDRDGKK